MMCERIAELLPDYLQGNLNHEQDDQIEEHLESCASCRADVAVWRELAHLPDEQPSPQLRARFEAMLHAYQEGQSEKKSAERETGWNWWSGMPWLRPALGLAAAIVLFAGGIFAGHLMDSRNSEPQQEIANVQRELTNMRQLLVLSMLQQQSASERLQGITWSTQVQQADPKVLGALLHALRYDSSVGVRLAALDALSRYGNQPQVRTGLVKTLDAQQPPLVQVALIDLLVDWRDTSAVQKLQTVSQDPNQDPAVRRRAELAVEKLNRGKL